ncbi:MAG: CAP domain-containing protein [Sphingomicrobium sp.]
MAKWRYAKWLSTVGAVLAVPLAAAPPPQLPLPPDPLAARVLALHNVERAQMGSAPLAWDPQLAADAASWAQYLAAAGLFIHSDRKARRGVGENLAMGRRGYFSAATLVAGWVAEKRDFIPGTYPANSRSGNWLHTAHYTQMIWPASQRIGCALGSDRGTDVFVCRYSPAGNIDGRALPAPRTP